MYYVMEYSYPNDIKIHECETEDNAIWVIGYIHKEEPKRKLYYRQETDSEKISLGYARNPV